jgi:hypothetical protein
MKINKEISEYDVRMALEIIKFFSSEPGKYYLSQLLYEREIIIGKGKAGRSEEQRMKWWAELDGYDNATTKWERIKDDMQKYLKENEGEFKVPYGLGGEVERFEK